MHTRITGKQARELLDGATPGPWEWDSQTGDIASPPYILAETFIDADANGPLIVSAPTLAETVAWLYGREPDTHHPDNGTWWDTHEYFISQGALGVTLFDGSGESRTLDAEQAVDLARALLNAAERMGNPE